MNVRKNSLIGRSLLHDERLSSLADPRARLGYLFLKLICDNKGRASGNPALLASMLFPFDNISAEAIDKMTQEWEVAGLVFRYRIGQSWILEISDHGEKNKLVGNMVADSEFGDPPQETITNWESRFGITWQPIGRAKKSAKDNNCEPVHTGSNKLEPVDTSTSEEKRYGLEEVEKREEENRRGAGQSTAPAATAAIHPSISFDNQPAGTNLPKTFGEFVGGTDGFAFEVSERVVVAVTHGQVTKYDIKDCENACDFEDIVKQCAREWANKKYEGSKTELEFVKHVQDTANDDAKIKTPKKWVKFLQESRLRYPHVKA